jgi:hypothetical protein
MSDQYPKDGMTSKRPKTAQRTGLTPFDFSRTWATSCTADRNSLYTGIPWSVLVKPQKVVSSCPASPEKPSGTEATTDCK